MKNGLLYTAALLMLLSAACSRTPEEQPADNSPPAFTFDRPDGSNVRTNAVFSGRVTDASGVVSATVRIGADGAETSLNPDVYGYFSVSATLGYTNGLPVVFRATDASNLTATVTNRYNVVDPVVAVWKVGIILYGTGWDIDGAHPLTVSILRRTNSSTNFSDYIEGSAWDYANQRILATNAVNLFAVFSNISTNDAPQGESSYDLVVYRDGNADARFDIETDFIIAFDSDAVDGLSTYESEFHMFLATGTFTLPAAVSNSLYMLMAVDNLYAGENAQMKGFGGGKIVAAGTSHAYRLALNAAGDCQIGAFVDTGGDGNPTGMGDYMGFYGSSAFLNGLPPLVANANVTTNGPNVFDFDVYEIEDTNFGF